MFALFSGQKVSVYTNVSVCYDEFDLYAVGTVIQHRGWSCMANSCPEGWNDICLVNTPQHGALEGRGGGCLQDEWHADDV